jgi:hypothetical protein
VTPAHRKKEIYMKKVWLLIGIGLVTALFALAAVACGDDESEEDAGVQLCRDVAELGNTLLAFDDIDPEGSKAEIEDAQDAVHDAYDSVASSAEDVADIEIADLESQIGALDDAIADIPDDATAAEGQDMLADEIAAADAALVVIFMIADCG